MSSIGTKIMMLCIVFIIYYCLNQIFSFYGVSASTYEVYYYFYVFLLISTVILPTEEPGF